MNLKTPGWEGRLVEFIRANRQREFKWGQWDCVQFALAALDAMAGRWVERPQPRYRTRAQARAVNRRHNLAQWLAQQGATVTEPAHATDGDLLIFVEDGHEKVFVLQSGRAWCPQPDPPPHPVSQTLGAWRWTELPLDQATFYRLP